MSVDRHTNTASCGSELANSKPKSLMLVFSVPVLPCFRVAKADVSTATFVPSAAAFLDPGLPPLRNNEEVHAFAQRILFSAERHISKKVD